MSVRRWASWARKVLSAPLFDAVRRVGTAFLTPWLFSRRTGHFRSAFSNKAVDPKGEPLPWYTYPAIDFLAAKSFGEKSVLEWGAGHSTLWWAARAGHVVAVEADARWHAYLKGRLPGNVRLCLARDPEERELEAALRQRFDVIVVDGLDRFQCVSRSVPLLKEGGALIVDDSEGYWGTEGTYPILGLLKDAGFQRVDFYGYAPGVINPHCTSLFFRERCFLLAGQEPPRRA